MNSMELKSQLTNGCQSLVDKGLLDIWDGEKTVTSYECFQEKIKILEQEHRSWLFRGQSAWKWDLETTLERAAIELGISLEELYDSGIEQGLIRRFKREYYRLSSPSPANQDHIAWMSIMRHCGSPTRLLDITYSPYVGLYFALNQYHVDEESALWCINVQWLFDGWDMLAPRLYHKELERDREGTYISLYRLVLKQRKPKMYLLNPYQLPERLVNQQGGFLLPIDVTKRFMENLAAMPTNPHFGSRRNRFRLRIVKIKLVFNREELEKALERLLRMNINSATLFPGLDGFARSLRDRMLFKEQRDSKNTGF